MSASAFSDHDLEHQRARVRLLVLEQLALKLLVILANSQSSNEPGETKALARSLLKSCTAGLRDSPHFSEFDPSEQAMLRDEHSEVFEDLERHLDFMLAG